MNNSFSSQLIIVSLQEVKSVRVFVIANRCLFIHIYIQNIQIQVNTTDLILLIYLKFFNKFINRNAWSSNLASTCCMFCLKFGLLFWLLFFHALADCPSVTNVLKSVMKSTSFQLIQFEVNAMDCSHWKAFTNFDRTWIKPKCRQPPSKQQNSI